MKHASLASVQGPPGERRAPASRGAQVPDEDVVRLRWAIDDRLASITAVSSPTPAAIPARMPRSSSMAVTLLRLAHDESIDSFDPQWLEPERLEQYRNETDRIRKVYLELLGLP